MTFFRILVIVGVLLGRIYFGKTVLPKVNDNYGAEKLQEVDVMPPNAEMH